MVVGLKIKQLRKFRNYTQAHMTRELQLSIGGYGNIERDEIYLNKKRLFVSRFLLSNN